MDDLATPRGTRAVVDAGTAAGLRIAVVEYPEGTRTAEEAADAIGCDVAQIVKSLVFSVGGAEAPRVVLALVSGVNQLDERRLAAAAGVPGRARRVDADAVRAATGFAIGGVPPFGHPTPLDCFVDRDLLTQGIVWAAAGTPRAVFALAPGDLVRISGGLVADLRRD